MEGISARISRPDGTMETVLLTSVDINYGTRDVPGKRWAHRIVDGRFASVWFDPYMGRWRDIRGRFRKSPEPI